MKERIIGAAVLVALVVVVVPVFLDGPARDGQVRTERVPLPGQDEQKTQTVVLERNRSEPVPAVTASGQAGGSPKSQPETAPVASEATEPAPVKAVTEEPAAAAPAPQQSASTTSGDGVTQPRAEVNPAVPAASPTGMFAVQLGSFSSKENAEKLAIELRKQGFAAFLSQLDDDSRHLHRVRVGPQKDRQAAESMAARLAKAGYTGQVVPHP